MRCVYCSERAGFIRRVCTPCAKVVAIVDRAGGEVGLAGLVDIFVAEGLTREQVDVVLDAQVGSEPTIRDRPGRKARAAYVGCQRNARLVRLDLRYARNCSPWLDLKILLATPRAVFNGGGAC